MSRVEAVLAGFIAFCVLLAVVAGFVYSDRIAERDERVRIACVQRTYDRSVVPEWCKLQRLRADKEATNG